jgi:hypothetical protein
VKEPGIFLGYSNSVMKKNIFASGQNELSFITFFFCQQVKVMRCPKFPG